MQPHDRDKWALQPLPITCSGYLEVSLVAWKYIAYLLPIYLVLTISRKGKRIFFFSFFPYLFLHLPTFLFSQFILSVKYGVNIHRINFNSGLSWYRAIRMNRHGTWPDGQPYAISIKSWHGAMGDQPLGAKVQVKTPEQANQRGERANWMLTARTGFGTGGFNDY